MLTLTTVQAPHVPGAHLHRELAGCYKMKLLKQGFRLVYMAADGEPVVLVLLAGTRQNSSARLINLEFQP
jgi:mRNA interferase RelE/StbE